MGDGRIEHEDRGWVTFQCRSCGREYPSNTSALVDWVNNEPGSNLRNVAHDVGFHLYWNDEELDELSEKVDLDRLIKIYFSSEYDARSSIEGVINSLETGFVKRLQVSR